MNARIFRFLMLSCAATSLAGCATQAVTDAVVKPTISSSASQRVAAADDPFNTAMLSNLAPGLIVVLHVTPAKIELQQAYIMLTPKVARHVDGPGDRIVATLSGGGVRVSETSVTDPSRVIEESFGELGPDRGHVTRVDERSVALSLPISHRVDALDIAVTATGQTAHFDVARLLAAYCSKAPGEPSCEPMKGVPAAR